MVALYLVAALGTGAVAGRRFLPLFDGFTRPTPYHWVTPPPLFAPGNVVPQPASVVVGVASGRSVALSLATADAQCSLSLPAGSLSIRGGDDHATAVITPIDPRILGPLPAGLHADGNAYRVELTSQMLDAPGNVVLNAPTPIRAVLYSADGRAWQTLVTHAIGDATVGAAVFSRTGMYLAAADADPAMAGAATGRGHVTGTVLVTLVVVSLAMALLVIPAGLRRLQGARG